MKKIALCFMILIMISGCFGMKPKVEVVTKIVKMPLIPLVVPSKPVLPKVEMTKDGDKIYMTEEAYKNLLIRDELMKGYVDKLETVISDENKYINDYNKQIEAESTNK